MTKRSSILATTILLVSPSLLMALNLEPAPAATKSKLAVYGGVEDDIILNGRKGSADAKCLYVVENGKKRVLWKSSKMIVKSIISPNGIYVGFVSEDEIPKGRLVNWTKSFHLHVISLKGKLIKTIEDGIRFSWDASGTRVVVVKGLRIEEGEGFKPVETGIYDLKNDNYDKLDFITYDVSWSASDHLIYYLEYLSGETKTYDPKTMRSVGTDLKGIHLSPDGTFYFKPAYEGGEFALYSRNNDDLTKQFIASTSISHAVQPAWISDHTLLLKNEWDEKTNGRVNVVYDVKTGKSTEVVGKVVGSTNVKAVIAIIGTDGSLKIKNVVDWGKK
jgi:hypothetical protein